MVILLSFQHPFLVAQKANVNDRVFFSGQAGTLPTDSKDLTKTYWNNKHIRNLILLMESGPVDLSIVEGAIKKTDISVSDLLRVKILRKQDDLYYIGFNYFNADDMIQIHHLVDSLGSELANAYLSRQNEFYHLFDQYPVKSVNKNILAFGLVAGISLNWDGLSITKEHGFRIPDLVKGEGWQYSFWASEEVPNRNYKAFYWGSSTAPFGIYNYDLDPADYAFSSFGDPYSEPRMNFPDIAWHQPNSLPPQILSLVQKIGLETNTDMNFKIDSVLGAVTMKRVANILFSLREKPKSIEELRTGFTGDESKLNETMALLEEIEYTKRSPEGAYDLLIPVFNYEDSTLVKNVLGLSKEIIVDWLSINYDNIRNELSDLTSLKHGVPFESLFTQVWHEFFGVTTRILSEKGFIADAYAQDIKYQGSFGILWRNTVYDQTFE